MNYLWSTIETIQNQKCSTICIFHVTHLTCSRFGHNRGFLNALPSWQFGKGLYVMARRLPIRFIGKCPGYFRYNLCVVSWFVNALVHQRVNDSIHKYAFTDSFGNHLTATYTFGNLAKRHLENNEIYVYKHDLTIHQSDLSFLYWAKTSNAYLICLFGMKGYFLV